MTRSPSASTISIVPPINDADDTVGTASAMMAAGTNVTASPAGSKAAALVWTPVACVFSLANGARLRSPFAVREEVRRYLDDTGGPI
jgi:hypothetical protein